MLWDFHPNNQSQQPIPTTNPNPTHNPTHNPTQPIPTKTQQLNSTTQLKNSATQQQQKKKMKGNERIGERKGKETK
jgi:hypothetical protein